VRNGIVGDLHFPFVHPMYLRFCQDVFAAWRVDKVHLIGDINDGHGLSFHEHDANGMSAEDEAAAADLHIQKWHRTFPKATVSIGNHDERYWRVAAKAGMPKRYLKPYKEAFKTPSWDWQLEHEFDGVIYTHGTGNSGKDAAINLAIQRRRSTVIGHIHSFPGVKWHANADSRIFGMNVGCGIDCGAYAFAYSKNFPVRPFLGCGIVLDGELAYFEPMPCGAGDRYNRSKAETKTRLGRFIQSLKRAA
jgi:hypothetical protein